MILPPPKNPKPTSRDPFSLEVLSRLPLAEAFYSLWGYLATDTILDDLFDRHRGRCYQDKLTFAELVDVLVDAITRYHGSGNRAITAALEHRQLSSQGRTVYDKLARLPLPLAEAFLAGLTARLQPLFPDGLYRSDLPVSLAQLRVVVLDGKTIKKAAKRLLATRGRPGKLHGGKILAAYLPAQGLAVAMAADPDGEANDIRLVPRVLPLARAAVPGSRLWVADSQFCDLDQTARFTEDGDHFLLRFTQRNSFTADPDRPSQAGVTAAGAAFTQEWGTMGAAADPRRRYVRRIRLERPGEEAVLLVTDLLDEHAFPGEDLLATYLMRWQIENVFQQITEVFGLRQLIGSAPGATVFQASLCLVIYNMLQVVRGYVAAGSPEAVPVAEVSTEKIFQDMHEQLISLQKLVDRATLLGCLRVPPTEGAMRQWLGACLGGQWSPRWRKAVNKKRRPAKPRAKQSGAHTSVHRLLQEAKQQRQGKAPTPQKR
jgi:hypothetical protein